MPNIIYGNKFLKSIKRLPKSVLIEFSEKNLPLLRQSIFQPFLNTKKLSGTWEGCFSSRVTHDYRVTFEILEEGSIKLLFIKHLKDSYKQ